jgi:hypothetical protein
MGKQLDVAAVRSGINDEKSPTSSERRLPIQDQPIVLADRGHATDDKETF